LSPVTTVGPVVGLMLGAAASPDTGATEPSRVVVAARLAEASGFDVVYVAGDHLMHPYPLLESVVTLAAVAASTERVSLGPCVMLRALRNPVVLAKQLRTLAAFAPGRLRVGVGVEDEYLAEFEAGSVPLPERGHRMELALRQVRSLLAHGVDHPGVTIGPGAPDVPFLLAGWKEVSLRRAAAFGDGWIGYLLGPDSFARRRSFVCRCREELGLAGQPFTTGMVLPVHVDRSGRARADAAQAWTRLTNSDPPLPERLFVAGRPDEVVEQLHGYWKAGCGEFVLWPTELGDGYLDQVQRLGQDVLPELRTFA
jgi:alkanesulfonate monooxygenase SsuD/methylene tetrahydromethanopterin reductase-like flavin-dependent oxidoreductase (luciferase family)